jgi:hypothetical protein
MFNFTILCCEKTIALAPDALQTATFIVKRTAL